MDPDKRGPDKRGLTVPLQGDLLTLHRIPVNGTSGRGSLMRIGLVDSPTESPMRLPSVSYAAMANTYF